MLRTTLAGVATLALAAIPLVALGTAAHAAPAPAIAVRTADIDTLSASGAQVFERRADAATRRFCDRAVSGLNLKERAACVEAVRVEISEQLQARNTALLAQRKANSVAHR